MRQILITHAGEPDVLRVVEGPLPEPGPGEVRVKVAAAGVNFADIMGRLGIYPDAPPIPYVPGYEVAGTIDAAGLEVDPACVGQDVVALLRFGGYSEYVCVPQAQTFPRPANLSMEQAAGFALAYLTAYGALVALAGIKPGEHVLIHSAAGGVGLAAIDICRRYDATIYGVASAGKHELLRARGVQHPIDREQDFEREVKRLTQGRGVQIVMDSMGGWSWRKSYAALSAGGRLVICGVSNMAPGKRRSLWALVKMGVSIPWLRFNPVALANENKGVLGLNLGRLWDEIPLLRAWADDLLAWQAGGDLDVHVDRVFTFDEAAEAHRYIQERRSVGKVILVPERAE
ncbi:MAG: zinc-binding dehydrogenase [Chloroflexi bacterium]|nr:zinc-binding dehydrogenase [Chloroflexota bacterium]